MSERFNYILFGLFLVLLGCSPNKNDQNTTKGSLQTDVMSWVDPFIGTGGHGHTYPGATVPFGMIQLSPDNGTAAWDWCSGYHFTDSIIAGFSHLHLSGTGIGDLYDIRISPVNRNVDLSNLANNRDSLDYVSRFSHETEQASPGYYKVRLEDFGIDVELTAGKRTGLHKYTFTEDQMQSVVMDLGFSINWDSPTSTKIRLKDKYTVVGHRHSTGWAKNQKLFYAIKFSKSIAGYDLWNEGKMLEGVSETMGNHTAVQLFFNSLKKRQLKVRVAVSSVSEANALANLASESNNFNFKATKNAAIGNWNDHLEQIQLESESEDDKTIFYSALYHSHLAPTLFSDVNSEFRLENDTITKAHWGNAYSTLSLWDTFRAEKPLLGLLHPKRLADIANSMLAYYQVNKTLPVWTLYGNETNTMTGYHGVPVIAEAILKDVEGIDAELAYEAMKNTMTGTARGLGPYDEYGYIPFESMDESVTITLELAYDDWCFAQVAKKLGKTEDAAYFGNRAQAYQKLFDTKTGFMRAKSLDGKTWRIPFDPKFSAHRVHADYTEGNAWQHSWFVPHDVENLISLHGGPEMFTNKLEQLFTEDSEITGDNVSVDISGLIGQYAHGNEPSHHIAYMFNKAGKPWRTQYWVNQILRSQYQNTPDGLSGNEDCGQMSAWYIFSALGIYPLNPSSTTYEIGSPLFPVAKVKVGDKNYFEIRANDVNNDNIYIQSAKLNGKPLNRTYITHQEVVNGGELVFQMGPKPNRDWGNNAL
ncbi:GH92 family glycosyl hydrolase [Sediminicola luteus]|uniref:Alpha-mannosidase n=1 Tax=Sediminicola luteus TaxID=319238 RepID=A0A2A4G5B2_9FLAO|nr:GH92 family glycosyl hydrolase [Sediminicola luteus]PCE63623.1 alpha-mannosidase [Sediminicola luteus]